ncbi:MAG: glycosyltransferase [Candidatus Eisenbacteria bacterium]|nr:glycosyltransferase [Candidatus Eisenbacteria bacterium]
MSEPPVKVMRIISRMNVGGPSIHVCLLTAGLREHGFETVLVKGSVTGDEVEMTDIETHYGVHPILVPALHRKMGSWNDVRALSALVALMRRERPRIVHTHTSKAGVLGRLAAWMCGVPITVHTFHGHLLHGYFHPMVTRFIVMLERALGRHTTRMIAVSRATRDDMVHERIVASEKLVHIPLGLPIDPLFDVPRKRGEFRAQLGVPVEVPLVGIVARLAEIKRHEVFLEAAARVRREMPEAHFALVGGGECEAALRRRAARPDLSGAVHFTGFRRDLGAILSDLDASALSSRNEGLPVAVIEAMAAGVPVVATDVGGVRELLGEEEAGLVVPPEDPEAFAAALLRLLRDPVLAGRLGRRGRERATRYREPELLRAIAALYRELLGA